MFRHHRILQQSCLCLGGTVVACLAAPTAVHSTLNRLLQAIICVKPLPPTRYPGTLHSPPERPCYLSNKFTSPSQCHQVGTFHRPEQCLHMVMNISLLSLSCLLLFQPTLISKVCCIHRSAT